MAERGGAVHGWHGVRMRALNRRERGRVGGWVGGTLIIATSLAPSPMARQQLFGLAVLTSSSICAFWSLRARHATTEWLQLLTAASTSLHSVPQYSIA